METTVVSEEHTVHIIEDSDREWNTREHQQIISQNQEGPVAGHYLQVIGQEVFTDGQRNNPETLFKVHNVLEIGPRMQFHQVVVLENTNGHVLTIDSNTDHVIAKSLTVPPSQFTTLEEVKTSWPEVLFYKVPRSPGSEIFYFKSFLKDKLRILGFDKKGRALNPTEVQPSDVECQFIMV